MQCFKFISTFGLNAVHARNPLPIANLTIACLLGFGSSRPEKRHASNLPAAAEAIGTVRMDAHLHADESQFSSLHLDTYV